MRRQTVLWGTIIAALCFSIIQAEEPKSIFLVDKKLSGNKITIEEEFGDRLEIRTTKYHRIVNHTTKENPNHRMQRIASKLASPLK